MKLNPFGIVLLLRVWGYTSATAIPILSNETSRKGFGPTDQEWGYVTVRPGAHMFWWLHKTTAKSDRPLVIWLQGGPGASSTGFGNFQELGPLDLDLKPRSFAWTNDVNVLFVDNPVGTGFSYVESEEALTTTNKQIADDFLVLLQGFYKNLPEFKKVPLYIFCESYGGKMTPEIALVIDQAIKNGSLDIKFEGVGLGDAWVSPIDAVLTWGPYLYTLGAVDQEGLNKIKKQAELTHKAVVDKKWRLATELWKKTEDVILSETNNVDFYNVLKKKNPIELTKSLEDIKLNDIMNNKVKVALKLNSTWRQHSSEVFDFLEGDFMKPVIDVVEALLNTTNIKVTVYNGQLDLIVDNPGVIKWVDELGFKEAPEWKRAHRNPLIVDNVVEGYVKKAGKFTYYWVNRAGHMVPADNPSAMKFIMDDLTNGFKTN